MKLKLNILLLVQLTTLLSMTIVDAQQNYVDKIFHHKSLSHNDQSLSFGNIVLYLGQAQEPVVDTLPKKSRALHHEVVYFLPGTKMTVDARKMLHDFNKPHAGPYKVNLIEVGNGIKIIVSYDADQVCIGHEAFKSIDNHQSLILRLYDKKKLDKLKNKGSTMLCTACADKPPRIVIDCGHGGHDVGAISNTNYLQEKDLALDMGLLLAELLRKDGCDVFMTRDTDIFLPLDQRTTLANRYKPDIFVSIHANSACSGAASGIETFYVADTLFKPYVRSQDPALTAVINAAYKEWDQQSFLLAQLVHKNILAQAKKKHVNVVNRGVRCAAAQVLIGTDGPCVLLETGFLSNPTEATLLNDKEYRLQLVQGVFKGIKGYLAKDYCV